MTRVGRLWMCATLGGVSCLLADLYGLARCRVLGSGVAGWRRLLSAGRPKSADGESGSGRGTARRFAVSPGVAGVRFETQAAVGTSGRVRVLGDDDPLVGALIGGPPASNAEEMGSQPPSPVLPVCADALVSPRRFTPDDA